MDLANLDTVKSSDEGAVMTVTHPTTGTVLTHPDDGRPFTIRLAGRDSERFRKKTREIADKGMQARARSTEPLSSEFYEDDGFELLAALTLEWDVYLDGQKAPFSHAVVKQTYRRFPWLFEQVDKFVGARSNFLKSAQPN